MRILHCCGGDRKAGAWIACQRINTALQKHGIGSSVFEQKLPTQVKVLSSKQRMQIINVLSKNYSPFPRQLGIFGNMDIVNAINCSDADIVHLHVPEGNIPFYFLPKIRKKLVWSLHDSWIFCGTELYPNVINNDRRYIDGYSCKNYPGSFLQLDLDKWLWLMKKHYLKSIHSQFVAPSHWEAQCFEESAMFHGQHCHVIPNCVSSSVFRQYEKAYVRKLFSLPLQKKIILFGAADPSAIIKGGDLLIESLKKISDINFESLHFVIFGGQNQQVMQNLKDIPVSMTQIGYLDSEERLAMLYSAADVFVCPSRIESFGNVCLESISCGTPVVAFRVGGIPDIIAHKRNGYLANPYDTDDLASGIEYCLQCGIDAETISQTADRFSEENVATRYIDLYQKQIHTANS